MNAGLVEHEPPVLVVIALLLGFFAPAMLALFLYGRESGVARRE